MPATTTGVADLFLQVIPQVMRVMAAEIRKSGLDIEPIYISLLGCLAQGDRSLGDLASVVCVSPPTMSKTISTLEGRDWVRRQRSEGDRRVVLVSLTPDGRSVLRQAQDYMVDRIADTLGVLDFAQCETLMSGLQVLDEVFAPAPSKLETATAS